MMDHDHHAARRRRRREEHNSSLSVANGSSPIIMETRKGTKSRRRKSRKTTSEEEETLSLVLVLQVGATLFVMLGLLYMGIQYMWPSGNNNNNTDDYSYYSEEEQQQPEAMIVTTTQAPVKPVFKVTAPPLPIWELSNHSRFDAYGLAENHSNNKNNKEFWKEAAKLRKEFASRYGGENAARAMMERGLSTFSSKKNTTTTTEIPSDLMHTACRIQESKDSSTFKMAFGGYSVTAGRGNFFTQSFPFVTEQVLKKSFDLLGIRLEVRNAAIGGVPSFPYGWCMSNFWGQNVDVVSWDYSMNEAGGVQGGLEAYLRHVTMIGGGRNPKLIVKDTHMATQRRELLQTYVNNGIVKDPLVVHTDPAVDYFLDLPEEFRPVGYQEWRRFGAPPGAPGQAYHHPAVKEHELIGWLIAMHILSALELVASESVPLDCSSKHDESSSSTFPPPTSVDPAKNKTDAWSSLLFGQARNDKYSLNLIQCRTSYDPIVDGDLKSVIVSGTAGEGLDIMLPKGPMYYNKGWVLDLGDKEKLAKRKLDRFGGLGFVDSKKAYYGIYASGPLRLLLPYEPDKKANMMPQVGDNARSWFSSVVVCEVNEKRDSGECNAETDVTYVIGGVEAVSTQVIDSDGTLYLGKKLCMYVRVPDGAQISSRKAMRLAAAESAGETVSIDEDTEQRDEIGLPVEISVKNVHIYGRQNACSVSHVVWEQAPQVEPSMQ